MKGIKSILVDWRTLPEGAMVGETKIDKSLPRAVAIGDTAKETIRRFSVFSDKHILMIGRPGMGMGVVAALIHDRSQRAEGPLEKVSLRGLTEEEMEVEIFGGHSSGTKGILERGNGGDIVLTEIEKLPLHLQAKLHNALQDMQVIKKDGSLIDDIDVRMIFVSREELFPRVMEGTFLEELYNRMTFKYRPLPLKERKEDLLSLIRLFMYQHYEKYGEEIAPRLEAIENIPYETIRKLESYGFPMNTAELWNMVSCAIAAGSWDVIELEEPEAEITRKRYLKEVVDLALLEKIPEGTDIRSMLKDEIEQILIEELVNRYGKSPKRISEVTGINVRTLMAMETYQNIGESGYFSVTSTCGLQ